MMILITYDVNTETAAGKKRLRKVAKECLKYGQRVQNSVFECVIDPVLLRNLQYALGKIIDVEKDSVRFYNLGNNWNQRVDRLGVDRSFEMEGTLIV